MSWRDIMRRVLPPTGDLSPEITSAYGATKGRKPPASIPHGGVDFNYPIGQTGINLKHPVLRSPVAGVVTTNPGEGSFGRIAIRDANGLSHEILHTGTQYVKRGDLVGVGQPIGSMGNTGTKDQHVHYQLKDSAGGVINPMDFWDRLWPAKSDPGQPAYLREYQQYLQSRGADGADGADRLGNAASTANMPAPGSFDAPSDGSLPLDSRQSAPRLGQRIVGKPSFFDTGTSAVPLVPPNNVLSFDRQISFDNRFGNWTTFPNALPDALASSDSFDSRFGNWTSSPAGSTPRNPNLPVPPPEPGVPPGIFSGKPMPTWTSPLGALPNSSSASGNNARFTFPVEPALQNSTPAVPPPQTGSKLQRSLSRTIASPSQASVVDTGAPAAPLAPSDDPNYAGGLLGRLVALAGIDPQNPNHSAAPTDYEDQADIGALDAMLSSSRNIRDAVALYNARRCGRR